MIDDYDPSFASKTAVRPGQSNQVFQQVQQARRSGFSVVYCASGRLRSGVLKPFAQNLSLVLICPVKSKTGGCCRLGDGRTTADKQRFSKNPGIREMQVGRVARVDHGSTCLHHSFAVTVIDIHSKTDIFLIAGKPRSQKTFN